MDKLILEIRAGTGGEEACIFVKDLLKAYENYFNRKKYKFEVIDATLSDIGYKNCTLLIEGEYNILINEAGVHREQRVPETEKNGRVHTSTVGVSVLKHTDITNTEIDTSKVVYVYTTSRGPGGQSVNTTYSAVRATYTHKGQTYNVLVQVYKSQQQNKALAIELLQKKIYELEKNNETNRSNLERSSQIGGTDRSEKFRTYNYKQDRVTNHINNKSISLRKVLEGYFENLY